MSDPWLPEILIIRLSAAGPPYKIEKYQRLSERPKMECRDGRTIAQHHANMSRQKARWRVKQEGPEADGTRVANIPRIVALPHERKRQKQEWERNPDGNQPQPLTKGEAVHGLAIVDTDGRGTAELCIMPTGVLGYPFWRVAYFWWDWGSK